MTQGHTIHPRLLWKWQGVACYIPWAHIPVGRGSVVAELVGGGGGLDSPVWPRREGFWGM